MILLISLKKGYCFGEWHFLYDRDLLEIVEKKEIDSNQSRLTSWIFYKSFLVLYLKFSRKLGLIIGYEQFSLYVKVKYVWL